MCFSTTAVLGSLPRPTTSASQATVTDDSPANTVFLMTYDGLAHRPHRFRDTRNLSWQTQPAICVWYDPSSSGSIHIHHCGVSKCGTRCSAGKVTPELHYGVHCSAHSASPSHTFSGRVRCDCAVIRCFYQ